MISRPKDYDETNIGGEMLAPGGHKCRIMDVREATSKNGSQMLIVAFDTDETDKQPMYYQHRYLSDKRPDKKWGGNMYVVVDGQYGTSNLKRFCTAVEDSNKGFSCWSDSGELKAEALKHKLIGIVFRGEDYTKQDGTIGYTVKGWRFCNYETAEEQRVPERKTEEKKPATPNFPDGFMDIPADGLEDEGLPFN